ncbi:MAG: immune inhibitor A, partial [Psychrosphaera sp.]|nr:immune inhibitor A [Psychrosphaera sp.]
SVDGAVVLTDGAEGSSSFTLNGFDANHGYKESEHYYLLEWRNHAGVDKGLQHVSRVISYEPGLLIWYRDTSMENNAVGDHPGESWIGVIDADVQPMYWTSGALASNRYQLRDATFSLTPTQSPMTYTSWTGNSVTDLYPLNYSQMADWNYYQNPWSPQSGRILQHYGMYITVEGQSADRSQGKIRVRKMW